MRKISFILLALASFSIGAEPSESLLGFEITPFGISYQVKSNGCTKKVILL